MFCGLLARLLQADFMANPVRFPQMGEYTSEVFYLSSQEIYGDEWILIIRYFLYDWRIYVKRILISVWYARAKEFRKIYADLRVIKANRTVVFGMALTYPSLPSIIVFEQMFYLFFLLFFFDLDLGPRWNFYYRLFIIIHFNVVYSLFF